MSAAQIELKSQLFCLLFTSKVLLYQPQTVNRFNSGWKGFKTQDWLILLSPWILCYTIDLQYAVRHKRASSWDAVMTYSLNIIEVYWCAVTTFAHFLLVCWLLTGEIKISVTVDGFNGCYSVETAANCVSSHVISNRRINQFTHTAFLSLLLLLTFNFVKQFSKTQFLLESHHFQIASIHKLFLS